MRIRALLAAAALIVPGLALTACHSYRIDAVVENRTGAAIELLEVDYPSASFGADKLAAGADFRYPISVRASGTMKVQYTETATQKVRQANGPELFEHQEGRIEIVLMPEGKTQFHPEFTAQH